MNSFRRLLSTVDYDEAKKVLDDEQSNMMAIADSDTTAQSAAKAGIEFLGYIKTTWMPEALWQGWSQKGRVVAAMLLNIPIEGVLPTTNHLESFNCLLKRRYIPRWQRSGARLRFDFLIHILITKILPEIFAVRRSQQLYSTWLSARFRQSAGGSNLGECVSTTGEAANSTRLYWYAGNQQRDEEAEAIYRLRRIYNLQLPNTDLVEATCAAASASLQDPHHPRYSLWMHRAGLAFCTCPDFAFRGGACKHLRALRMIVNSWVVQRLVYPFYHPSSLEDARQVFFSLLFPPSPGYAITPSLLTNLSALRQVAAQEASSDVLSEPSEPSDPENSDESVEEDDGDTAHVDKENGSGVLKVRCIITV
jgi:hypothetical protein